MGIPQSQVVSPRSQVLGRKDNTIVDTNQKRGRISGAQPIANAKIYYCSNFATYIWLWIWGGSNTL